MLPQIAVPNRKPTKILRGHIAAAGPTAFWPPGVAQAKFRWSAWPGQLELGVITDVLGRPLEPLP